MLWYDHPVQPRKKTIWLAQTPHTYTMRRSRRARQLAIRVDVWRGIEVVVPWRVPYVVAQRFVSDKRGWLQDKVRQLEKLRREMPQRALVTGTEVPLLDKILRLEIEYLPAGQRARIKEKGRELRLMLPIDREAKDVIERWYRRKARDFFEEITEEHAKRLRVKVKKVVINDPHTQWGSCSSDGKLSFGWRLMLAPRRIASYVAAHEVAHIKQHDHTEAFWKVVERLDPAYRARRRWLKEHEHKLVL
jgi:predicted metal-dependent hydrolase